MQSGPFSHSLSHMGPNAPSEFSRLDKYILLNGMINFDLSASDEEIREDIISGLDLSTCKPDDTEFVKRSGKVCRIPETLFDFSWSGTAIKHLFGQGDLYVRLKNDVGKKVTVKEEPTTPGVILVSSSKKRKFSRNPDQRGASTSRQEPSLDGMSQQQNTSSVTSGRQGTVVSRTDYQESSNSEDDDLPRISIPGLPPKSNPDAPQPSITDIYEMFRNMPKGIVDKVYAMSNKDSNAAINTLLELRSESILDTLRREKLIGKRVKITVDEDDIFNDAIVFYKSNDFDPIVVKMENQPAFDTGGIRRQFFTDVLEQFALNDSLSLFIGEHIALCPHHSPPLLRLLGTIVAHSLVHGGPGFSYLASYI